MEKEIVESVIEQKLTAQDFPSSDLELIEMISTLLLEGRANCGLNLLENLECSWPENGDALFLKGLCLAQLKRYDEAIVHFFDSFEQFPNPPMPLLIEIANCQYELGQFLDAANTLASTELVTQKPSSKLYLKQAGILYYKLQLFVECIDALERYIETHTDDAYVYEVLASAFEIKNRPLDAIKTYQKALKNGARSAQACRNIAVILTKLDRRRLALKYLEQAAKLDPTYDDPCNKFMCAASILEFDKRATYQQEALDYSLQTTAYSEPFPLFFATDDPKHLLKANTAHSKKFDTASIQVGKKTITNGILKIGYMSADFKNHATTYLIEELIRNHDRSKFIVYAFDFSPPDAGTQFHNIREAFDEFIDLSNLSDASAAETIANLDVDILIDLKGYTRSSRPGILSYRPAPIQINYLGYPGTMGNPNIDYIIGDSIVTPIDEAENFSEKIIELTSCYQPNMPTREVAKIEPKSVHGLPDDKFIFCCFNHHWKWTQEILNTWKLILDYCPESILWVLKPIHEINLDLVLEKAGIDPDRVISAPLLPINKHLARIGHANLFLDTFPCGGHTTASDSIRSGVPVLCVRGNSFHSRVSASIMTHASCSEFVCSNVTEYLSKATDVYNNPESLAKTQEKLRSFGSANHPFNIQSTVKQLEKAFSAIANDFPAINHKKISP